MGIEDTRRIEIHSRAELRAWLEANHACGEPAWAVVYKKHHEHYLPYEHLVEELLCFGWIDSTRRALDADRAMQYITPRKRGSIWSGINKRRVEALEGAGLMTEAGRAVIRRAEEDGSWSIYDEIEQLVIPPDLATLLGTDGEAETTFESYPRTAKMAFLWWIKSARTEETRRKRLEGTLLAAQRGIRVPGQARR